MKRLLLNRKGKEGSKFKRITLTRFTFKGPTFRKYKLRRLKRKNIYHNFPRLKLISKDRVDAERLIRNASCYKSYKEEPKNVNPNEVCFTLSEGQKQYWIDFIDNNDDKLFRVKVGKRGNYCTLKLKSGFIIFTTEVYVPKLRRTK